MSDVARERREALVALTSAGDAVRADPPILLAASPYFDLAGEEFGRRLLLTPGVDGLEYCLRPDFTLPIAMAHLNDSNAPQPASYGYLGPIFRQREGGPAEFEQAGLELIGMPDSNAALNKVLVFAADVVALYGIKPTVRLGSVELFETVLANADMPDVWRARIRHRFGHPEALSRLLDRLADPHGAGAGALPWKREELVGVVADQMVNAGLSLTGSRAPEEIAERYFEKQALAAAKVPVETVAFLRAVLAVSGPVRKALITVEGLAEDQGIDISGPTSRVLAYFDQLEETESMGEINFDGGFSPRLDYYTGVVFEMHGANGSLASGGEYNRLMQRLGADARIAASGCAVWVDRLEKEAAQ